MREENSVVRNQYGSYVEIQIVKNKEEEFAYIEGDIRELMKSMQKTIELKKGKYVPGTGEIIIKESAKLPDYFTVGVKFTMEEPGDE